MGSLMAGWDAKRVLFHKNASMTKEEVKDYWRNKRIIEEEHLLAAFKCAARIKVQKFLDEDYRRFEESLAAQEKSKKRKNEFHESEEEEVRIGIKDWWTKSSYAYLNQPPMKSTEEKPKPKSNYVAQFHIATLRKSNNSETNCFGANALRVF